MHATKKSVITSVVGGIMNMKFLHVNFSNTVSILLSLIGSESLTLIANGKRQDLFSSTQTPLGWSKGKKARVTSAPHSMIWYFVS